MSGLCLAVGVSPGEQAVAQDREAVGQGRVQAFDDAGQGGAERAERLRAEAVPPAGLDLRGYLLPGVTGRDAPGRRADERVRAWALAVTRIGGERDIAPAA